MRSTLISLLALAGAANAAPSPRAGSGSGSAASISNMKDKIKNVIVLMMENRSLDNLLGGQKTPELDNPINNGPFCNPLNLTNPLEGFACTAAADYNEILDDPDHAIYGNNIEFFGDFTPNNEAIASGLLRPTMQGFCQEQIREYQSKANKSLLAQQVMNYYTEEQVPVITALTQNFLTFNYWFSDIPGPTNPNRVAFTSGTSAGYGANTFNYGQMQQLSIFQQLTETGHSWRNYYYDDTMYEALWYNWTYTSGNTKYVQPLKQFYSDAAQGNLSEFTWINPSCCGVTTTSMHPTGLITNGEQLIKDVYEAIRASPQWNETLFVLTFDETGGFHDHVPPPNAVRPDNLTYTAKTPSGANYTFSFDRLGGRMPTWLISPWVASGKVEQLGTNSDSQTGPYHATSFLRTAGYLWNFSPFNKRVELAPSFDHLIGKTYNDKAPAKLPDVVDF